MRRLTAALTVLAGLASLTGCDSTPPAGTRIDPWANFQVRPRDPLDEKPVVLDKTGAKNPVSTASGQNGDESLVRDGRVTFDGDTRDLGNTAGGGSVLANAGTSGGVTAYTAPAAKYSVKPVEPPLPVPVPVDMGDLSSPEPKTALDKLFYSYGTACYGMDWRFLKAVAQAESGLDPKNHTGKYVGLFQLEPELDKGHTCGMYIKPFKDYLRCDNLEDPETNIAIAAHRFNRHFKAEMNFQPDSSYISMMDACPEADIEALTALAYVGHNNGPGVLKYILRNIKKNGACELGNQEAAVRSYYSNPRVGNTHGWYENPGRGEQPKFCARASELIGQWSYHCVSAAYGARKWRYGVARVVSVVKKAGVTTLYPEGARDPAKCPALNRDGSKYVASAP